MEVYRTRDNQPEKNGRWGGVEERHTERTDPVVADSGTKILEKPLENKSTDFKLFHKDDFGCKF